MLVHTVTRPSTVQKTPEGEFLRFRKIGHDIFGMFDHIAFNGITYYVQTKTNTWNMAQADRCVKTMIESGTALPGWSVMWVAWQDGYSAPKVAIWSNLEKAWDIYHPERKRQTCQQMMQSGPLYKRKLKT